MFIETQQKYIYSILDTNNLWAIKINFSANLHPDKNENHQHIMII